MGISVKKIEKWERKKKAAKLIKALDSNDKEIRMAAIKALGSIEEENSVNTLVGLLRDTDPDIRAAAVESLGKVGNSRSVEFVRYTVNNDSDENVRQKAGIALNLLKEKVEQELASKR